MMRIIIALIFLCLYFPAVTAQQKSLQLTGYVTDVDRLPLENATIVLKENHQTTRSDKDGRFLFANIAAGNYTINISLIGYQLFSKSISIKEEGKNMYVFSLESKLEMLRPVTITAEKKEGDMQKIALPVTAISGKQVEERKINGINDLLFSAPNMVTLNAGAPTLNLISIRGVLTYTTDPAIGVYVDNVPMFDGYSSAVQLQDIARIEILRGPQSTLYGKSGLGGVINIITKQPTNTLHGFAEAGYGNYNSQRYNLGLSGPIVRNKLFAGFSGLYDTRNGYFTNVYTGKKFDKPKTYNGNFYLKYLAGERLQFLLNAKAEYNDVQGTFPYSMNIDSALKNPYLVNQNEPNTEKRKLYTTSLNIQYKARGLQLNAITAYTFLSDKYAQYDNDLTPYDIYSYESPVNNQKTITQEFKIVTDDKKKVQFTGGIFAFIDLKKALTTTIAGADAVMVGDSSAPYRSTIHSYKKVYGLSSYANLTYAFTGKWKLSAGLRYDFETRNMTTSTDWVKDPYPLTFIVPEKKINGSNQGISPRLSLSYSAGENLMFYTTYARGYRPGGFNQYTPDSTQLTYNPEHSDNIELGAKSEWFNHKLRANISLFYTHWLDQQQIIVSPVSFLITNKGKLFQKGMELELAALPFKGMEINYNLGVFHSKYEELNLFDYKENKERDYSGNKQIYAPAINMGLSLTYRYFITNKSSCYIIPEWKYLGKQYLNYYNDLVQDPFSLFNATAGFQFKNFAISIWGKNIANKQYIAYSYAPNPASSAMVLLSTPRTYGATLRTSF